MSGGPVFEVRFEHGSASVAETSNASNARLVKWKVKIGSRVTHGSVIALYDDPNDDSEKSADKLKRFKVNLVGTVLKLLVSEGDTVHKGCGLLMVQGCSHPIVMKNMCAECGADLLETKQEMKQSTASVAMVHSIPELVVSKEQAQILGRADEDRLIKSRKLVLLVDLDQTLVHTTNDEIPNNLKDVHHFQLYGSRSKWYHVRIRPGTEQFLKTVSKLYELHICTFGARYYAHIIAKFLDKDGRYFSHRILSRDECVSAISKMPSLKALFPCGDQMVCIIDDREDVWNYLPNVVQVKPYHFFQHTGDINAPPGLTKTERDNDGKYVIGNKQQQTNSTESSIPSSSKLTEVSGDNREQANSTESPVPSSSKPTEGESEPANDNVDQEHDKAVDVEKQSSVKNDETVETVEEELPSQDSMTTEKNNEHIANVTGISEEHPLPLNSDEKVATVEAESSSSQVSEATDKKNESDPNFHKPESEEKESSLSGFEAQISNSEMPTKDEPAANEKSDVTDGLDIPEIAKPGITEGSDNPEVARTDVIESMEAQIVVKTVDPMAADVVEVDDEDDYLLYLTDILKKIHTAFYKNYDHMRQVGAKGIPNLRNIVPLTRRSVLRGVRIVFSGVIPTNVAVEKSHAYQVAKSLGAEIQPRLIKARVQDKKEDKNKARAGSTTHVVAARLGTVKVIEARRMPAVHIVTPEWLWCCASRWDHVDERIFPLTKESETSREKKTRKNSDEASKENPVATKVSVPRGQVPVVVYPTYDPITGKRINKTGQQNGNKVMKPSFSAQQNDYNCGSTYKKVEGSGDAGECSSAETITSPAQSFVQSINPLMSFGSEDIASMDQEVEDFLDGPDNESTSDEEDYEKKTKQLVLHPSEHSSSSDESLGEAACPKGWANKKRKRGESEERCTDANSGTQEKYLRGELPVDSDRSASSGEDNESADSIGSVDDEMADAVERQLLEL